MHLHLRLRGEMHLRIKTLVDRRTPTVFTDFDITTEEVRHFSLTNLSRTKIYRGGVSASPRPGTD